MKAMATAATRIEELKATIAEKDAELASLREQHAVAQQAAAKVAEGRDALIERARLSFESDMRYDRFQSLEYALLQARAKDAVSDVLFSGKTVTLAPFGFHERNELREQLTEAGLFRDLPEKFERHIGNIMERPSSQLHQANGQAFTAGAGAVTGGAVPAPKK
ncbi:MAG: hypothetical protein AB7Q45_17640 [Planctomycetaceae bacterium]